jgi:integrase
LEILQLRRTNFTTVDGEPRLILPTTKNGRPHEIPLPTAAVSLFNTVRGLTRTDYLFPARHGADTQMAVTSLNQAVRRSKDAQEDVAPSQPRDLRRMIKTLPIERDESLREPMKVWRNYRW